MYFNKKIKDKLFKFLLAWVKKQKQTLRERLRNYQNLYSARKVLKNIPMYLVLGPKNSGKSHIFSESILAFSNKQDFFESIFAKYDMHSWVSESVIGLEATLEPDKQKEWIAFIKFLKKLNRRLPLNGIYVTLPVKEWISEEEISKNLTLLTDYLNIFAHYFGLLIPVKIITTQCDSFHGFLDFFSGISDEETQQVFGIQTSRSYVDLNHISDDFKTLINRLYDVRIQQLSRILSWKEKINIHLFPDDFSDFCEKITKSLKLTFSSIQKNLNISWQGICFTAKAENKNLFIKNLFSLSNHVTLERTSKQKTKNKWLLIAGILFSLIISITVFFSLKLSYNSNKDLLIQGSEWLKKLKDEESSPSLTQKSGLHHLLGSWQFLETLRENKHHYAWLKNLGLYRGNHFIQKFEDLFFKILNKRFISDVKSMLYKKLKLFVDQDKPSDSYQTLKSYLMLWFPHYMDTDYLSAQLSELWIYETLHRLPADFLFPNLNHLINFYLKQYKAHIKQDAISILDLDWEAIEIAREQLKNLNPIEHVYLEWVSEKSQQWPALTISKLIRDPEAILENHDNLSGIYTAEAWKGGVLSSLKKKAYAVSHEDWVLSLSFSELLKPSKKIEIVDNEDTAELNLNKLKEIYFKNYLTAWINFLNAMQFKSFHSLGETSRILNHLLDSDSALRQYFSIMASNLEIVSSHVNLKKIFDLNPEELKKGHLPEYFSWIKKIETEVEEMNHSVDINTSSEQYAIQLFTENKPNLALYQANLWVNQWSESISDESVKVSFRRFLQIPLKKVWRVILDQSSKNIEQEYISQILNIYQNDFAQKIPLVRQGSEVDLSSFSKFFNPETGIVAHFFKNRLSHFLYLQDSEWSKKSWLEESLILPEALLKALKHIIDIGHLFYRNNQSAPSLDFDIYPVPDPAFSEIHLTLNAEIFRYHNGPQEWIPFHWVAQASDATAVLHVIFSKQNGGATLESSQPFGWFELLSSAEIIREREGIYRLTWVLKDSHERKYPLSVLMRVSEAQDFIRILEMV